MGQRPRPSPPPSPARTARAPGRPPRPSAARRAAPGALLLVADVAPLTVGDRYPQHLAGPAGDRERRLHVLDAQVDPDAAVLERIVAHQGAGQQVRLAEDLEAGAGG